MMGTVRAWIRRLCRHCRRWFTPSKYNPRRQRYCFDAACRVASRRASQGRWLAHNRGYFGGPEHCERVRAWRLLHPGYWRRASWRVPWLDALQDLVFPQGVATADIAPELGACTPIGPPRHCS